MGSLIALFIGHNSLAVGAACARSPSQLESWEHYILTLRNPPPTGLCAGWDASDVGSLIAVLGLASIPVSFAVGAASARVSDRALTAAALVSGVAGCALLTQAGHAERSSAYFAGARAPVMRETRFS